MKIIDLTDEHRQLYFWCLEDWSDEIREGCSLKEQWFNRMEPLGLRVRLALDDDGKVGGMIQYLPIEHSTVSGEGLYFIPCIWVHGYKDKGVGNMQGKGMGQSLLRAAEEDAKALGAKGMAAWGISLPFWMKASWFKKLGYREVDKDSIALLMWKSFSDDAVAPKFIKLQKKPEKIEGQVTVTAFCNGWCPAQNMTCERAKRAAEELGDRVVFTQYDTSDRETLMEWGISDALYVDGKGVRTGPPPSYEKIYKLIAKRVRKLK